MDQWIVAVLGLLAFFTLGSADLRASEPDSAPPCLAAGQVLGINDSQVLGWETSTEPEFHGRAHVSGPIVRVYPDMTNHQHFLVQIGPEPTDTVEIVFDVEFGRINGLAPGEQVEACGDFINTSGEEGHGSYTSSIVHWVHEPFGYSRHEAGYTRVNGVLYGM